MRHRTVFRLVSRVLLLLAALAALLFVAVEAIAQSNLSVAAVPANEQRVALVIGNSAYKASPLRNPVNDATDMANALRELGFKTTLRTNASQRQMKDAIREFGAELTRGGVGLFYFAGHGVQYKGHNFLVPIGATIEREAHIEDETVNAAFVLAHMEEARNRINLVILDACRDYPYTRGMRSASRGLAPMDAAQGTLVAFATAPGAVAQDGDGRNGIYTKHLLRQIRQPGVPVELMFKRVRDGVIEETKKQQVPWEWSSLSGADLYLQPFSEGIQVATVAPSKQTEPAAVPASAPVLVPPIGPAAPQVAVQRPQNPFLVNVEFRIQLQMNASNKTEFTTDSKRELDEFLSNEIKPLNTIGAVIITGHTDRLGTETYNKKLSEQRALAAKDYIVNKGIDQKLIFWEGNGAKQPLPVTRFCTDKMSKLELIACLAPNNRTTIEVVGTRLKGGQR